MDAPATVRSYYERIDAGEYGRLGDLLASEFVHERPDRTLEGADRFVRFMREERPDPDTTHEVETVYAAVDDGGDAGDDGNGSGDENKTEGGDENENGDDGNENGDKNGAGDRRTRLAVEGRLLASDGEPYFRFVDAFRLAEGRIVRLVTYTG